jgi:hypothetical protein
VQMQLGLGQAADKGGDVGHTYSLVLTGTRRIGFVVPPHRPSHEKPIGLLP